MLKIKIISSIFLLFSFISIVVFVSVKQKQNSFVGKDMVITTSQPERYPVYNTKWEKQGTLSKYYNKVFKIKKEKQHDNQKYFELCIDGNFIGYASILPFVELRKEQQKDNHNYEGLEFALNSLSMANIPVYSKVDYNLPRSVGQLKKYVASTYFIANVDKGYGMIYSNKKKIGYVSMEYFSVVRKKLDSQRFYISSFEVKKNKEKFPSSKTLKYYVTKVYFDNKGITNYEVTSFNEKNKKNKYVRVFPAKDWIVRRITELLKFEKKSDENKFHKNTLSKTTNYFQSFVFSNKIIDVISKLKNDIRYEIEVDSLSSARELQQVVVKEGLFVSNLIIKTNNINVVNYLKQEDSRYMFEYDLTNVKEKDQLPNLEELREICHNYYSIVINSKFIDNNYILLVRYAGLKIDASVSEKNKKEMQRIKFLEIDGIHYES